ncbi:MAG: 2-phospho-L-lactate guanylyltransferase [Gordonia sp. (in: high G+C Gram-positive bacteria)]|uniref:2-phospho-L-lactate guanylyltransferase n=1 Tax=Gordonia sp. (in: high G+C Gram-positive bacteria) TaxID=84139 RepID=UPI0039E4150D
MRWGAVLAVKPLPEAKSRLDGAADDRSALVLAMLADVLAATAAAEMTTVVVTPDPRIAAAARASGALTADEPGGGLNAAFAHGQREFAARAPAPRSVMFLQADLPAVTATDLRAAIAAHDHATGHDHPQSFVADHSGGGTAALLRPVDVDAPPLFGPDSAARHRAADVVEIGAADQWAGLRTDVDTLADLARAARVGVGPATAAWLAAREQPATGCGSGGHGA